jgi:DNA polymerase-3 subunit alpha
MPKFVHLHTHCHYSLLDGLTKPDALVKQTKDLGMDAVAITDHGNMYAAVEFYKKAKAAGVKPIIGLEVYVAKGSRFSKDPKIDNKRYHLTLLVKDKVGYKNIVQLATKSHLEGFYYKPRVDRELLEQYHEGLVCLSGCFLGEVSKFLEAKDMVKAEETALAYKKIFGDDYYLEIQPHAPDLQERFIELSKKTGIPLVATQDSHYLTKEDKPIHEVLLAIQTNNHVDSNDKFSFKNFDGSFRTPDEMAGFFKNIPEAIDNTVKIADKCNFEFELGKTLLPKYNTPAGETANSHLRRLAYERMPLRFPIENEEVKKRLEYELGVIDKTGFADYFLIVQDFVGWAKKNGIVVGPGRGSAAGSLMSFILGITDLDPLKYNLLFERFLNPERISMPDIDLDFADKRRDEVLGYIKATYGEDRVAQIITFGTMAARAALRDAGRALGYPYSFCDEIAKLIPFHASTDKGMNLPNDIKTVPELKEKYEKDPTAKKLLDTAVKLEGVARHASVHACGIVVSEKPLTEYMPLQRSPQDENSVITQFEMHSVEDLGILKIDLLGLKNLTIMEETIRLVKEIKGIDIKLSELPLDDKKTFKLLQSGETTGVFQFESSGMRHHMKELIPTELEDLISLVALYRPGPMELIPTFINRKLGKEKVEYLHPKLESALKNTYGIGVYQEQMMQIARDIGGFTLGEADILRKAIGKKIKNLLDAQKEKLINGMLKNGVEQKTADAIWELFPPFAKYGFNRSHAACYALIGYQTAYLKAQYPVEYTTALLNNAAGDVERVALLINEARRMNIAVLPPDVNKSVDHFVPEGSNVRFGILAIKNIGANITEIITTERMNGGPYEDLADLMTRIDHRDLNKKSIEALIKSGSLDSLGVPRAAALKNIDNILKIKGEARKATQSNQINLFGAAPKLQIKFDPAEPESKTDRLAWEKELLGLYITDHPLKEYIERAAKKGVKIPPIKEILKERDDTRNVQTYGVISKIQHITTKKGDPMIFAKIEDLSDTMEALVFNDLINKDPLVWKENNIIQISGKISRKNGEPKLICNSVIKLNK